MSYKRISDMTTHQEASLIQENLPEGQSTISTKLSSSKELSTSDSNITQNKENVIDQRYRLTTDYIDGDGNQLRLYYTKLEPVENITASLCIVHGLGEHSGRYMEMADHFAKQGFIVHMIDMRGFGYSGYPRANASVEELHKDIHTLLKQASQDLPLFIYAHSMGCGLTSSLLIRNPHLNISGVIFTSGLFGIPPNKDMNWGKRFFAKILGEHLGEITVNTMINPTSLTRNNINAKKTMDDSLMIQLIGMRMTKTLVELMEFGLPNALRFEYPCLVIHGNADTLTNSEDSVKFYKNVASVDKTLKIFEGGYHELQFDHDKELLKKIMSDWLSERVAKTPKKLGKLSALKIGLQDENPSKKKKIIILILLVFYFIFLTRFRKHQLYSTTSSLLLYPLYYLKNVLFKAHDWRLKV